MASIVTERGTVFEIVVETDHYLLCEQPKNGDSRTEAIFDFDSLARQGYFFTHHFQSIIPGPSGRVLFEKRSPALARS